MTPLDQAFYDVERKHVIMLLRAIAGSEHWLRHTAHFERVCRDVGIEDISKFVRENERFWEESR